MKEDKDDFDTLNKLNQTLGDMTWGMFCLGIAVMMLAYGLTVTVKLWHANEATLGCYAQVNEFRDNLTIYHGGGSQSPSLVVAPNVTLHDMVINGSSHPPTPKQRLAHADS